MRILHTIAARDWGGIACRTVEQVEWLNAHGHSSWLACPADSEVAEKAAAAGIPVVPLSFDRPFSPATAWKLRHLVNDLDCEIIESHTGRCANAALWARDLCALIRTRHTTHLLKESIFRTLRSHWGWDWTIASADVIAEGMLSTKQARSDRLSMIGEWCTNNRLDQSQWPTWRQHWRAKIGVDDSTILIGTICMLRPEKGVETLIRSVLELVPSYPMLHAVIVGESPSNDRSHQNHLKAVVQDLGLQDRIHFIGHQNDVAGILQAIDLMTVPSTFEAQCRVVAETLSNKRPLIASRVGGIPELVRHHVNGWLVPPNDVKALTAQIDQLLSDPAQIGSLSAQLGDELHIDAKMKEYMDVYAKARQLRFGA